MNLPALLIASRSGPSTFCLLPDQLLSCPYISPTDFVYIACSPFSSFPSPKEGPTAYSRFLCDLLSFL